jgi:SAM-dependent methyltransferase
VFDQIYQRLLRFDALRHAQWFFKSEPSGFTVVTGLGHPCPACTAPATYQSDYPSRVPPFAQHRVLYCSTCGLGFVPNMAGVLAQFYKQEYASSNRGDREAPPVEYFSALATGEDPAMVKYAGRVERQIKLLRRHGARFGRVLDYGSGPGYFLYTCAAREAHAIEPDELSHKYLHHIDATIHHDVLTLPETGFETIVASHVIEHLPAEQLHDTLVALVGALAPGGRLLIEVPQGGHSYLHLGGQRQDPHTLFFTGRALVEALRGAGATILFQKALGRIDSPLRDNGVYTPEGKPFYKTLRGSLTVICTA